MNNFNNDRRRFIKGAAAAVALTTLASSGMGFMYAPDKTYRVALIGTGWYGKSDVF
jgi:hypothetical protein